MSCVEDSTGYVGIVQCDTILHMCALWPCHACITHDVIELGSDVLYCVGRYAFTVC